MSKSISQDGFDNSFKDSDMDMEPVYFQTYGMHFCGTCKNLMTPSREMNEKLQFTCKLCKEKEINFSDLKDSQCIIYNKQLKPGTKKFIATEEFVRDPTMARIDTECPACEERGATMLVSPGENERCLQLKLICNNALRGRCNEIWTLPESEYLLKNRVMDKQEFEWLQKQ